MTAARPVELRAGARVLTGIFSPGTSPSGPLLVALHGASYDAHYFDAPGASVHERASRAGLPMLSITRPGYPATPESARAQPSLSDAASIVTEAVAGFLAASPHSVSGVIVLGHSVGGAVTMRIAAAAPPWPLAGIAVSGIGDVPARAAVERFAAAPADAVLVVPPSMCRASFYGPDGTFAHDSIDSFASLNVPFPSRDVVEVNTSWPIDFPAVAAQVTVPVHLTLAEHDGLWETGHAALARMSRAFGPTVPVELHDWPGTGHNIEHHLVGPEYCASVFEFARRITLGSAGQDGSPGHGPTPQDNHTSNG